MGDHRLQLMSSNGPQGLAQAQEHLVTLLRSFDAVLVSTADENDDPDACATKPMPIAQVDDDCTLYFITDVAARQVGTLYVDDVLSASAHVFAQASPRFLVMRGCYRLSRDKALLRRLWSRTMDSWFDGPDDPRAGTLIFTPTEAELWDRKVVH